MSSPSRVAVLGDTEIFAQHFNNLLDAFLPSSPPPPKSASSPYSLPTSSAASPSPIHPLTTLEPISRISLPPTPPPNSSPLPNKPASDFSVSDPSPARPRPKRAVSDQPPCYPRPKKRQHHIEPFAEAGARSPIVAQKEEEGEELQLVPDSDHERAAEAYLSPPPSSLPDPDPTTRTIDVAGLLHHVAAAHAHAVSSPSKVEEGPGKKKEKRPRKTHETRLEQLSVAEVLHRAEKLRRKARREERRSELLRKEEKRRKKRERRRRQAEKERRLPAAMGERG